MAGHLWCRIGADVAERYGVNKVSHALLARAGHAAREARPHVLAAALWGMKPWTLMTSP
jgi:DNA polymerase-3 subunit epsilon